MFPLKRFIQGPSLHDEVIAYGEEPTRPTGLQHNLSGEEVSRVYEEIVNQPSVQVASCSKSKKSGSGSASSSTIKKPKQTPPTLSKLMSLCETNDFVRLEENLENFRSEIDIDAVDEYGWTLLMSASCAGAVNCVSILLQYGANWIIGDKKGLTAFDIAKKNRQEMVCDLLQRWRICYIERMERLEQGHSVDEQSNNDNANGEEVTSKDYCEMCNFHYESSKEEHDKSIAHLVSTAEFRQDKIHFGIPESNKGFQLMLKSGWDKNSGLGPDGQGHKFPVKTVLKRNKLGLGNEKERKAARITHFGPFDSSAVEGPYKRVEREVTVRRRETVKTRNKEKRKEINFRREFASL